MQNDIGINRFQLGHQRRLVGACFVVALVQDYLYAVFARADCVSVGNASTGGCIAVNDCDLQILGIDPEYLLRIRRQKFGGDQPEDEEAEACEEVGIYLPLVVGG